MRQLIFTSLALFLVACGNSEIEPPLPIVTCYKDGQVTLHGAFNLETPWYGEPASIWVSNPGGHALRVHVDECTLKYDKTTSDVMP